MLLPTSLFVDIRSMLDEGFNDRRCVENVTPSSTKEGGPRDVVGRVENATPSSTCKVEEGQLKQLTLIPSVMCCITPVGISSAGYELFDQTHIPCPEAQMKSSLVKRIRRIGISILATVIYILAISEIDTLV